MEATVEVEFGPQGSEGSSVRPWEGDFQVLAFSKGSGAGGGRGSSHPARVEDLQETRWRVIYTERMAGIPERITYRIGAPMPAGQAPKGTVALGTPDPLPVEGCVWLTPSSL